MKTRYLAYLTIALLTAVVAYSLYLVLGFKESLIEEAGLLDMSQLDNARSLFARLYASFFLLTVAAYAALIITILYYNRAIKGKEVVLVASSTPMEAAADHDHHHSEITIDERLNLSGLDQLEDRQQLLQHMCRAAQAVQAAVYMRHDMPKGSYYQLGLSYAWFKTDQHPERFQPGEGIVGQVAATGQPVLLKNLPEGYLKVVSGLGESFPQHLFVIASPAEDGQAPALVAEFAFFYQPGQQVKDFLTTALARLAQLSAVAA